MQQILIPTDFSKNAWNAIQYALQFFKKDETTFHFLHVDVTLRANEDVYLHKAGFLPRKQISQVLKTKMADLVSRIFTDHHNPKHAYRQAIIQTPFIEGIREYISKNNIQLIVMGTKGATGLKEMTLGSRTGAVITKVKCPILVIPEEASFKIPLDIGFPTDFNLLYNPNVINSLLRISKTHNASIKVLRVAQNQQPLDDFQKKNREILKGNLKERPYSFHVIENPDLENGLQSFVNTMNIDMIAMIAKNLNFSQRILFKPKVAQISYHIQIPFLILHD